MVTTRDNGDIFRLLFYSYYTTIIGCGVLGRHLSAAEESLKLEKEAAEAAERSTGSVLYTWIV